MTQRRLILAVLVLALVAASARAATNALDARPQAPATTHTATSHVPLQLLPGGLSGGGLSGAATNIRGELGGGAVVIAKVLGTYLWSVITSTQEGTGPLAGALSATRRILDPAFLLGNIPGGLIGGALGAMIPLPAMLPGLGLAGRFLAFLPSLAGAVIGSAAGMHAFDLARDRQLNRTNLLERMDLPALLVNTIGIGAAIVLAQTFLPPVMLGAVNVVEVAAAIAGVLVSSKIFEKFRARPRGGSSSLLATGLDARKIPTITGARRDHAAADAYRRFLEAERAGRTADARDAYRAYQALTAE